MAPDGALYDIGKRSGDRIANLRALTAGPAEDLSQLISGQPDGMLADVTLLPPIAASAKILCVGVNYPERNAEYKDGSEFPMYPTLFVRFSTSFVGHEQPLIRPPESVRPDYEGEIVIVVARH